MNKSKCLFKIISGFKTRLGAWSEKLFFKCLLKRVILHLKIRKDEFKHSHCFMILPTNES